VQALQHKRRRLTLQAPKKYKPISGVLHFLRACLEASHKKKWFIQNLSPASRTASYIRKASYEFTFLS
jgi:GH25 family lysozyme M1 (1,4-beta-N-acetylmuramidase)